MQDKVDKTPEELAQEYANACLDLIPYGIYNENDARRDAFLAGYEAGRPKWVSVKERMPISHDCVLAISNESAHIVAAYYNAEAKEWQQYHNCCKYWGDLNFVTHWQPLPTPPTKED